MLMAMPTDIMVFWDVITFSLAERYQNFRVTDVYLQDRRLQLLPDSDWPILLHYALCNVFMHFTYRVLLMKYNVLETASSCPPVKRWRGM
jgi:hypothetical protein